MFDDPDLNKEISKMMGEGQDSKELRDETIADEEKSMDRDGL